MASLDVSFLLADPDFADTLTARRLAQTVGSNGRAVSTTTDTDFVGVAFPGAGNLLVRGPDGERVSADMTVVTMHPLSAGSAGNPADEVVWRGSRYTVKSVQDYSNWGAGFVLALCDLIPVSGGAP